MKVASCSSRHENTAARLEEQCDTFLNADKIENFNDLLEKRSKKIHHQKYLLHQMMCKLICSTYQHNNLFPLKL